MTSNYLLSLYFLFLQNQATSKRNYLESIGLSLSDLVLGNTAVEDIPRELIWVLPIINQATNHNRTLRTNQNNTN